MARASALSQMLAKKGLVDSSSIENANFVEQINSTFGDLREGLNARIASQALGELVNPKPPDPLESAGKALQLVAGMAGVRSEEERREEREEKRRREEREEKERRELEMRRMEEARSRQQESLLTEMMKMQVQLAQAQAKEAREREEQARRESREAQARIQQMMEKWSSESKRSPIEEEVFRVGLSALRQSPPSIRDQVEEARSVLSLVAPPTANPLLEKEIQLKEKELDWKMSLEEQKQRSQEKMVESRYATLQTALQAFVPAIIDRMGAKGSQESRPSTTAPAAAAAPPPDPNWAKPPEGYEGMRPVQCEDCDHMFAIPLDAKRAKCPKCGSVSEVETAV